ncbi:hypothetical protein [Colwellia sp. E2M01]|uniref:hypothetical protein n=1 Tax=Colwellia sp. E2M01 TaxID=2841561 RepID=UPI001C0829C6|nr:hypothetical protein [Colwellia sp. E2M01]MBU2872070.1 hypothetical protein [Colwellia sp. E2M01]
MKIKSTKLFGAFKAIQANNSWFIQSGLQLKNNCQLLTVEISRNALNELKLIANLSRAL